jgi:hypothetical protein
MFKPQYHTNKGRNGGREGRKERKRKKGKKRKEERKTTAKTHSFPRAKRLTKGAFFCGVGGWGLERT